MRRCFFHVGRKRKSDEAEMDTDGVDGTKRLAAHVLAGEQRARIRNVLGLATGRVGLGGRRVPMGLWRMLVRKRGVEGGKEPWSRQCPHFGSLASDGALRCVLPVYVYRHVLQDGRMAW